MKRGMTEDLLQVSDLCSVEQHHWYWLLSASRNAATRATLSPVVTHHKELSRPLVSRVDAGVVPSVCCLGYTHATLPPQRAVHPTSVQCILQYSGSRSPPAIAVSSILSTSSTVVDRLTSTQCAFRCHLPSPSSQAAHYFKLTVTRSVPSDLPQHRPPTPPSAAFPLSSLSLYRFNPCTAGMLLDLLSPLYPPAFLPLLCIGSVSRAISECNASELSIQLAFAIQSGDGGVGRLVMTLSSPSPSLPHVVSAPTFLPAGTASGATRAALTQHFALQQNAADISAKVRRPVDATVAERCGAYAVTACMTMFMLGESSKRHTAALHAESSTQRSAAQWMPHCGNHRGGKRKSSDIERAKLRMSGTLD